MAPRYRLDTWISTSFTKHPRIFPFILPLLEEISGNPIFFLGWLVLLWAFEISHTLLGFQDKNLQQVWEMSAIKSEAFSVYQRNYLDLCIFMWTCCLSSQHDCCCLSCHNNCFNIFLTTSLNKPKQTAKAATNQIISDFYLFRESTRSSAETDVQHTDLLWQRSPQSPRGLKVCLFCCSFFVYSLRQ